MKYHKITFEFVVPEDEKEVFMQAMNDALDRIEQTVTVFGSDVLVEATLEPPNAEEIAAER